MMIAWPSNSFYLSVEVTIGRVVRGRETERGRESVCVCMCVCVYERAESEGGERERKREEEVAVIGCYLTPLASHH